MIVLDQAWDKGFIEQTLLSQMVALEDNGTEEPNTPDNIAYTVNEESGEMHLTWSNRLVIITVSVYENGYSISVKDSSLKANKNRSIGRTRSFNAQPAAVSRHDGTLVIYRSPENGYSPCGPYYSTYDEQGNVLAQRWWREWTPAWITKNPKTLWNLAYSLTISGYLSWVDGNIVRTIGNPLEFNIQPKDLNYNMDDRRYAQIMIKHGIITIPRGVGFLVLV